MVTSTALFLRTPMGFAGLNEPKIMPRPSGVVYVCGYSDTDGDLPFSPAAGRPKAGKYEALHQFAKRTSTWLRDGSYEVTDRAAVYTALTPDGLPLLGAIQDCEGVYVACGFT